MHMHSPRLRICERCWHPVATSAPALVQWQPGPEGESLCSYRHIEGDPSCTGDQSPAPTATIPITEAETQANVIVRIENTDKNTDKTSSADDAS